jgi:Glycosyl hydrolase family 92
MVEAMGGRVRFNERLVHALSSNLIDITNEPSFSTPWLFHNIGRADLSSYWAREVSRHFTATAYPGDEDAGAMSSNYVFNRLGLFPKLGSDRYYLHGPRHARSVIQLGEDKSLEIVADNAGYDRPYIAGVTLNGTPLETPFVTQAQVQAGGKLAFSMSAAPGQWLYDGAVVTTTSSVAELVDGKSSTVWTAKAGDHATFERTAPVCLKAYTVSTSDPSTPPSAWRMEGWDGKRWVRLDTRKGEMFDQPYMTKTYGLKAKAYARYRFAVTAGKAVKVAEIELIAAAPSTCMAS